jgi:protein-L-isoaspartate(D-aspartate) O-methyltransferase
MVLSATPTCTSRVFAITCGLWAVSGCGPVMADPPVEVVEEKPATEVVEEKPATSQSKAFEERTEQRLEMVRTQLAGRDIRSASVLKAMRKVPRHALVPDNVRHLAYADHPLPIGLDQTISQPYIVAAMTQALDLKPGARVLEVGTGSGYQAAVLAELVAEVYTVEIVAPLAERARKDLGSLGYKNIHFRTGDGYKGWPEAAPFDAIIVTAAPPEVPPPLVEQLKEGAKLVIPVGRYRQNLLLIERTKKGVVRETLMPVRFVPMTGKAQEAPSP